MKKGIKTTEFWVAMSGLSILIWDKIQARCQFDYQFLLMVGGVVITYILGRSWVKSKQRIEPNL